MIADSDAQLCHLLKGYLGQEAMVPPQVQEQLSTADVLKRQVFDLLKLDTNMSKGNRVDTLKTLRLSIDIAILLSEVGLSEVGFSEIGKLTGKEQTHSSISDLMNKTKNNVLNLNQPSDKFVNLDNLTLIKTSRQVMLNNEYLDVTSKEFNLLLLLTEKAGDIVSKEVLSEKGIGAKFRSNQRAIDVHISNLRKKLGRDSQGRVRIKTVRSIGYQYVIYPDA